jgi:hypothetical protein
MRHRPVCVPAPRSGFAGFRFPPEVIMVAMRWYLRSGLSYREVQRFRPLLIAPLLIDAARPCRHLRRGHYELGPDADPRRPLSASFTELPLATEHGPAAIKTAYPQPMQQHP